MSVAKEFVPSLSPDSRINAQVSVLTVREVATLLKVSTATVYAMVDRGELPHVRVSNAIRIPAEAVRALVERSAAR